MLPINESKLLIKEIKLCWIRMIFDYSFWELIVPKLVKISPYFNRTRMFIMMFTRFLSSARWMKPIFYLFKNHFNISYPFTPRSTKQYLPSWLKFCNYLLFPHGCYITRPGHHTQFGILNNNQWKEQLLISSLCNFLHSLLSSFLLGPVIFLCTLFSIAFSQYPSFCVY
jgi:hypothetical protein